MPSCHYLHAELTPGMFRARQAGDGRARGRGSCGPHVPAGLVAPATSLLPLHPRQPAGQEGWLAFRALAGAWE